MMAGVDDVAKLNGDGVHMVTTLGALRWNCV
jgi:hypothetical protein